jgi:hypothetical protein
MSSLAESSSSQPLLHTDRAAAESNAEDRQAENRQQRTTRYKKVYNVCRQQVQDFLSSRAQHYTVLGLVSFDLLGIFADIIINLYQCDEAATDPKWNDVRGGLGIAGLVFSCLFMVELLASVWAFGWRSATSLLLLLRGSCLKIPVTDDLAGTSSQNFTALMRLSS